MMREGLLKKYELSSFQELIDYVLISGVVYLKPEILEFLKKAIVKHKKAYAQNAMSKLGKAEPIEIEKYMQLECKFYEQDFLSLSNFLIENNVKLVWVLHALVVDGFCAEEPVILDLIKACKEKNIRSRKNTVARLVKDKYIDVLAASDCSMILSHLTKKFDNKEFDVNLIEEIITIQSGVEGEEKESDLDKELNKKFAQIKKVRDAELEGATDPVILESEMDLGHE